MSADLIKILAGVVIFVVAYAGGMLAMKAGATRRGDFVMTLGLAFAGGVFLASGLIHLLPEGIARFEELGMGGGFPLAPTLAGIGLIGVLMFEKVAAGTAEVDAAAGRQGYLLLAVLSVHSLVAGAALGLEVVGSAFVMILIAILAHKGFAAFSLGVSFARSSVPRAKFKRLLLLFSCTTPLGLLLGLVASNALRDTTALYFEAVFDSLAAGTFLYVATLDLMHDAFEEKETAPIGKFIAVVIGFSFMGVLALWA